MDKLKVLERVKRLLAMANDASSPNEALIAAKRARKLMDEHQIESNDLIEDEGFKKLSTGKSFRRMPIWLQGLSLAVADWNECVVRKVEAGDGLEIQFIGFESDALIAHSMYMYLIDTISRLSKTEITAEQYPYNIRRMRNIFRDTASARLSTRIEEIIASRQLKTSSGTDLVVAKRAAVESEFGATKRGEERELKVKSAEEYLAAEAGRDAGDSISLNTQIKQTKVYHKRLAHA